MHGPINIKYLSIWYDSRMVLKALEATRTTSSWYYSAKRRRMTFPPPFCGDVLRSQTFWGMWKWSCRLARKRSYFHLVFWTRTCLAVGGGGGRGVLGHITRRKKDKTLDRTQLMAMRVLAILRDRLGNWSRAPVLQLKTGYCHSTGYILALVCYRPHYWTY